MPTDTPQPSASELSHLEPRDGLAWLFVGSCAGLTGLSIALSAGDSLAAWLAGQVLLACALVQWFVLLHECGHETLFRTKRLHAWVGHLASFFAVIPFHAWKRVHGKHHKWTGWQDLDPTTALLVPKELGRVERTAVNVCWRYWIPLFSVLYRASTFWNLPRLRRMFAGAERQALTWNLLLLLAAYAGAAYLVGPGRIGRLAGLALLLSLLVEDPLLLSQHTHIPQHLSHGRTVAPFPAPQQDVFTRSLRVPAWVSTCVLLHLDAHELHHMYPFVPGYHLGRIDHVTANGIDWWQWLRSAKRLPGEVFLFQNRNQSGFHI